MEWDKVKMYNQFNPAQSHFVKKSKLKHYSKDYICLDTETSWNHDLENPRGWVYQWCFYYQNQYIIGRTIEQFIYCLKKIKALYTDELQRTIIFVHNLSYDIQYLKNHLIREFGEYNILAVDKHKFISFTTGGFEFRCTYKLSNRSLDKWSKDLNTKHKKLCGTIDYEQVRYKFSQLNRKDWKYMLYDVIVLKECIEKQLEIYNDKIYTLPLTSTGYVRREARRKFKQSYEKNRAQFLNTALNKKKYLILKKAFQGGLTHGNRFYANQTINGKIKHFDFDSHYPTQLKIQKFPVGKFNLIGHNLDFETLEKYMFDNCVIMDIYFKDLEIKDKSITLPYLQSAKCRQGKIGRIRTIEDNGRILKLDGLVKLSLTEIDLEIIREQYNFGSYNVETAYASKKGNIPRWLDELIDEFYKKKTVYKNKAKITQSFDDLLNLLLSKNTLNGIYGMCATDIVRNEYEMCVNGDWIERTAEDFDITEKLEKYYNSKNNFMMYQIGVYVTAYARKELVDFVKIVGYDNFLYADTDSIFFIATNENINAIENKNKEFLIDSKERKKYIIYDENKIKYYHKFDDENEEIMQFRFLHSKCYAYVTSDEKLHCTIAGVTRKNNGITREKELGSIDELKKGKTFYKNGGTRCIYVEESEITDSCAIIVKTTKTLNSLIDNFYDDESEICFT